MSVKEKYFKSYQNGPVGSYSGWIEIDGECVGFVDIDNKLTWMSDLG